MSIDAFLRLLADDQGERTISIILSGTGTDTDTGTGTGTGTGLGMAVCYGIVQGHNGQIAVRSNVGQGTTFRVTLPIRQQAMG